MEAGTQITLNQGDQNTINQAIVQASQAGGGAVYLNAGTYEITGTIKMLSNVKLAGDSNAIVRVSSSSSQWFTGTTGIISSGEDGIKNIEICGFQIDGNCENLPYSYASSPGHERDCERCILISGDSSGVKIHDMKLYDSFSDGIFLLKSSNSACYNNFISNCEHEGIYYSVVSNSIMANNQIAGISSDCARCDNCQNVKVTGNVFFSYTGDHTHGSTVPLNLESGFQVGDAGVSKGYDARKSIHTENIEVSNNTFTNMKGGAFSPYSGYDGVYVHDNKFVGVSELKTAGVPVTITDAVNDTGIVSNVSENNPPTVEMSQKVFGSIFDILNLNFGFQYLNLEIPINATAEIVDYNNTYNPHALIFVNETGFSSVRYSYNGSSTIHYVSDNIWKGDLPNEGDSVYIPGNFDKSKLKIAVFTPRGFGRITKFDVAEENDQSGMILSPDLWGFVGTLSILGISIFRNLRRVIRW